MKLFKIILLTILSLFVSCENKNEGDKISISGRKLLVNDKQFLIKGICYHPIPKGSDQLDFSSIDQDLALMVEAGINTIRVYAPIDDEIVLDKIYNSGIKLIVGFGYNQGGNFDIHSGTFIDYINKYKNHKAILMWELGNEYNYHPEWFVGDMNNWYTALNNATELIHKTDENHPVTTAHGELPTVDVLAACPNIDVWGMNVYRWDDPTKIFSEWEKLSTKPMYLSEAGGDSYMTIAKNGYEQGINEKAQADANAKILESIFNNKQICSGVAMFSFTDGWWKAGNNNVQDIGGHAPNSSGVPYDGSPNEEFWGIVDIERNKKLTFEIIKQNYKSEDYEKQ